MAADRGATWAGAAAHHRRPLPTHRRSRPTPAPGNDDPRGFADRFVRLLLEIDVGRRPARHVRPLVDPAVAHQVASGPPGGRGHGRLHRVTVVDAHHDRCEVVAIVRRPHRFLAIALELTRTDQGWCVTSLERPGDAPRYSSNDS